VVFGSVAVVVAFRVVGRLRASPEAADQGAHPMIAGSGQAALAMATAQPVQK